MRRSIAALVLSGALAACGGGATTTLRAEGTERAPAAKADIDVEREGGHNDIDVQVSDLVEPGTLGEQFSRYGVWMVRDDGSTSFLGFLNYQSDIEFGALEAQAPLDPVDILVTAEGAEVGSAPSDVVVLRRRVQ
jgi:hypothetical protein